MEGKERKGREGKEREGKEREGKGREGREGGGEERRGEERRGKERKGKEWSMAERRKGRNTGKQRESPESLISLFHITLPFPQFGSESLYNPFWLKLS